MIKFSPLVKEMVQAADFADRNQSVPYVGIIIHHTGLPTNVDDSSWLSYLKGNVSWLTKKDENYVSSTFIIGRMGEISQLVDLNTQIAYHAGNSSWWHPTKRKIVTGWNQYSIGIELVGDGNRIAYSDAQYESLGLLCRELIAAFPTIDPRCITGHECISPGRKTDPGLNFNWNKLFRRIYGS